MLDILSQLAEIPYRYANTVPYALPFIWMGAILGHSFVAIPAKFKVPTLTRPVAMEVGFATFSAFFILELIFLAGITATMVISDVGWYLWLGFSVVTVALFLQRYYLRPIIFNRVADDDHNRPLPSRWHFRFYSVLEIVKLLALIGLGSLLIRY